MREHDDEQGVHIFFKNIKITYKIIQDNIIS
jgi:hypothetical protein